MTDKLPSPCDHCNATGIFHGSQCPDCRGKGYLLMVDGPVTANRAAAAPRGPNRNASGSRASGSRYKL